MSTPQENIDHCVGGQRNPDTRPVANADQEAIVQARIKSAMNMAIKLHSAASVGADHPARDYGMRGIAEGAAREIIETLGLRPAFINIAEDAPSTVMLGREED